MAAMRTRGLPALLAGIVLIACGDADAPASGGARIPSPVPCAPAPDCWEPEPTTKPWQWQLQGAIDLSVEAPVYDIDMDVAAHWVDDIHAQGDRAICYLSVGTWEPFRDDAGDFPKRVKGKRFPGFEEERWLDVRRLGVLRPIMRARFDRCAAKGFDAVEPDIVDAYSHRTGFDIGGRDQRRYNAWVANAIHSRGMAVGLKNDLGQVKRLLSYFDFAVNEQCFQFHECGVLDRFIDDGKPVFGAEYELSLSEFCSMSLAHGFSTIRKRYSLRAFRRTCD